MNQPIFLKHSCLADIPFSEADTLQNNKAIEPRELNRIFSKNLIMSLAIAWTQTIHWSKEFDKEKYATVSGYKLIFSYTKWKSCGKVGYLYVNEAAM